MGQVVLVDKAITGGEEMIFVAKTAGRTAGFGAVVPATGEIRAVYVHPAYGRRGIGSKLLRALEAVAKEHGCPSLHLDASLNAEAFYRRRGSEVLEYGKHTLSSGLKMPCVKMRKMILG